jgi:hypothetical protein
VANEATEKSRILTFVVDESAAPVKECDVLIPRLPAAAHLLEHVKPKHNHAASTAPAASRYSAPVKQGQNTKRKQKSVLHMSDEVSTAAPECSRRLGLLLRQMQLDEEAPQRRVRKRVVKSSAR